MSRWIALIEREDKIVVPCMTQEDDGCIEIFNSKELAEEYLHDVPLYKAFGGYVINIDEAAE
ncbi:hypothetical protein ACVBEG_02970 [Pseudomonas sp. GG8]